MIYRAVTSEVWPEKWDVLDEDGRRYRLDTTLFNAVQAAACYAHADAREAARV